MAIKNVSVKDQKAVEIKIENTNGSIRTVVIHNVNPIDKSYIVRLIEEINLTNQWQVKSFSYEVLNAARIINTSVAARKRMMDDNPNAIWETEFEEALLTSIEFGQNIIVTPQDILDQLINTHYEGNLDYLSGLAVEAILNDGQKSPEEIDDMPEVVRYQFWNEINRLICEQIFDGLFIQNNSTLRAVSVTKLGRVLMAILFDLKGVTEVY